MQPATHLKFISLGVLIDSMTDNIKISIERFRRPKFATRRPSVLKRLAHNRITYLIEDACLAIARPLPEHVVNKTELRILGMRRSGNHGIINWMMRAANAGAQNINHIFLNNCKIGENAYRLQSDWRPPEYSDKMYRAIQERRNRAYLPVGLLVRSYEDYDRSHFIKPENQAFYGRSCKKLDGIIIRDPLNLFASRIKVGYIESKSRLSLIDLYLDHVSSIVSGGTDIPIIYNQWILSKTYREEILAKLHIEGPDLEDNKPANFGPGSSFSPRGADLDKKMLLLRWQDFRDDPWFKKEILGNSAIMDVTRTHFPEVLS